MAMELARFVLAGRTCATTTNNTSLEADRFSSGQLHRAASSDTQTVSFTEQPPAIDTELLEWSAPRSSLKHQTVSLAVSSTEQPPATLERSTTMYMEGYPATNSLVGTRTMAS